MHADMFLVYNADPDGHTAWDGGYHPAWASLAGSCQKNCQALCGKKTSLFCLQCSLQCHYYVPICGTHESKEGACLCKHKQECIDNRAVIEKERKELVGRDKTDSRGKPPKSKYLLINCMHLYLFSF